MAVGWSVVLERDIDGVVPDVRSGKSLLYFHHQIDDLAARLGLASLSGFFSRSPQAIAQYLRGQGVEPDLEELPDEEWFEAEEGLTTVRGLLAAVRDNPASVPESARILTDLELVERALSAAAMHGVRFHLGRELENPESNHE